jgi:hypothetical protein
MGSALFLGGVYFAGRMAVEGKRQKVKGKNLFFCLVGAEYIQPLLLRSKRSALLQGRGLRGPTSELLPGKMPGLRTRNFRQFTCR